MRQGHVELERLDLQLDLGRYQVGRLAGRDPAGIAHQLEQRQVRNRGPVGQAAALHHGRAWLGHPAELPGQPGLAQARVTSQAHHLALAADRQVQRPAQLSEFTVAAGERAQLVAGADPGRPGTQPDYLERLDRSLLDLDRGYLLHLEVAADRLGRPLAQQHRTRLRGRLQPGGQHGGVAERGVVHPEAIADRAHYHQAAVNPDPDLHLGPADDADRRQHRTAGMILVRDRCPEQRHEPVAEELVDGSGVAVHLGQRVLEEAVDDLVKILRPQLPGQVAGAHDVAEQHGDLLALAPGGTRDGQDLLADMPRGVARRTRRGGHRAPASGAEPGPLRLRGSAVRAGRNQARAAIRAETRVAGSIVPALRAPQRRPPPCRSAPLVTAGDAAGSCPPCPRVCAPRHSRHKQTIAIRLPGTGAEAHPPHPPRHRGRGQERMVAAGGVSFPAAGQLERSRKWAWPRLSSGGSPMVSW